MSEYKEDQNLPEAAASANTKIKSPGGFTYQFTMRSESVKTLMMKIMDMEVWFKQHGWVASENGNVQVKESGLKCKTCGGEAELRSGVSSKGKPYKGIFCLEEKDHVSWLKPEIK